MKLFIHRKFAVNRKINLRKTFNTNLNKYAKQNFSNLIGKAKQSQVKTPAQKVVALKEKKDEIQFSLYIPAVRLKQLKMLSAEQGISLKNLINSAIEKKYFK